MKGRKRSIIKKYFTPEVCLEMEKVTMQNSSNNAKGIQIEEIMKNHGIPSSRLGTGTNRIGFLIDGYAVKIALDKDGKIDNKREFKYSKQLQPYAIKVYEVDRVNGLIAVTEYINCFREGDFMRIDVQAKIRNILSELADDFLIGDVGIDSRNFANWGMRKDGSICMLDFAYIYAISFRTFECRCGAMLRYDNDFVDLVCERCRKKYTFGNIRKKISRQDQMDEIGDITELGYVLTKPEEMVELVTELEPELLEKEKEEKKKEPDPLKKEIKRRRKMHVKKGYYRR